MAPRLIQQSFHLLIPVRCFCRWISAIRPYSICGVSTWRQPNCIWSKRTPRNTVSGTVQSKFDYTTRKSVWKKKKTIMLIPCLIAILKLISQDRINPMAARLFSERIRLLENGILASRLPFPIRKVHSIPSIVMERKRTCWTAEDVITRCGTEWV